MDPWNALGSLSHPLGDAGPVLAVACHPSRTVVAACLSNGHIGLWDYQGAGGGGRSSGCYLGGVGGVGNGDASGVLGGGGDGYIGGPGGASPPASPPRSRGSIKAGKDDK